MLCAYGYQSVDNVRRARVPTGTLNLELLNVCLLLNGTSALFRPLVPKIVEVEHVRYVKNDL